MQFGRSPVAEAAGAILAHGVRRATLSFRKGRVLSAEDLVQLKETGVKEITIARLEAGEIGEDQAAGRIAIAAGGDHVRVGAAFTGRANLYAQKAGLVLLDTAAIHDANRVDEAITLATLPAFTKADAG